jgi:hypothetical protein
MPKNNLNKHVTILILVFTFVFKGFSIETIPKNAFHSLYKNSSFFVSLLTKFDSAKITICEGNNCLRPLFTTPVNQIQNRSKIFGACFNMLRMSYVIGEGYFFSNDSIADLLISFLDDSTEIGKWVVDDTYKLISEIFPYTFLEEKTTILQAALVKQKNLNELDKYELLISTRLSAKTKDSLLRAAPPLPLHFRARLGDVYALDSLITQYDAIKFDSNDSYQNGRSKFQDKKKLVQQLAFSGEKGVQHLILKFNEEMYDDRSWYKRKAWPYDSTRQCYEESIRWPIILGILKWHPNEQVLLKLAKISQQQYQLFENGLKNFYHTKDEWPPENKDRLHDLSDSLQFTLGDFLIWAQKTYGIRPEGNPPKYIYLRRYCGDPDVPLSDMPNPQLQKNIPEAISKLRKNSAVSADSITYKKK